MEYSELREVIEHMHENIKSNLLASFESTSGVLSAVEEWKAQLFRYQYDYLSNNYNITQIVQDYCDILTNDLLQPALDISWLNELKEIIVDITMPALSLEITNYREQISEGEAPSNDGTLQVFTSAIEAAMPFAPCEEQQQYTAVLSEAKNATHRKITLNDLLAFLSLLISLYSAIIASLPNEQLDKIISNQEAIITQQAEQESQEHSDLVDAIEILQDGICSLANEVNALREQIEELNNSVDPESDGTDSNIQEDD